jgi:hypothetical protein
MTYKGEPYGLPYYADIASFIWNPTVAKNYGVDRAPTTWDEVMEMSVSMKAKGLTSPILWEFSQTDPSGLAVCGKTSGDGGCLMIHFNHLESRVRACEADFWIWAGCFRTSRRRRGCHRTIR